MPDEAAAWRREMAKGWTRLAVLTLLARGESYGYAIVSELAARGLPGASEGTVYVLLRDLERRGAVTSSWRAAEPGVPARKYYEITAKGRRLRKALLETWRGLHQAVADWLEET